MIKSIVNQALFRILSPIIIGLLAYILLLLFNNQLDQLQSEFINLELFIFIVLALLIQESTRFVIRKRTNKISESFAAKQLISPLATSLMIAVTITTMTITFYFKIRLGYAPEYGELIHFNIIFLLFTLVYFSLYLSFFLLEKDYSHSMKSELCKKQEIESDFIQYKNGINPTLLFECFESLIVLTHKNVEQADELLDNMAQVYRYILSPKYEEVISIQEEWNYVTQLVDLFKSLPYRKVEVKLNVIEDIYIVKGTMLTIIEAIIRSVIASENQMTSILVTSDNANILLDYNAVPKLQDQVMTNNIEILNSSYRVYSDQIIMNTIKGHMHQIRIPILQLQNQIL